MKPFLLLSSFCLFALARARFETSVADFVREIEKPDGPIVQTVAPTQVKGSVKDQSSPFMRVPVPDYSARILFEAEDGSYVADVSTRWPGRSKNDRIPTKINLDSKVKKLQIIKVAEHTGVGSPLVNIKPEEVSCEALDENGRYLTQRRRFGPITQHAARFIFEGYNGAPDDNDPLILDTPTKVSTIECWEGIWN